MNIYSQIGLIMLIGLVTKNGILIVEFANQRQATGLDKSQAIVEASVQRFRPILMTSISTVLGLLPLMFATGEGANGRIAMGGTVVVGGLLISTLLTLYLIPAMYMYLSTDRKAKKRRKIMRNCNMSKKIKEVLSLLFFFIPFITSPQSVINLQECLRIGIENNYDLRIARNEEMISDNNVTPGGMPASYRM